MDVLLTIGEFSKMTYLSVKALRHYHDVGLLEPAAVEQAGEPWAEVRSLGRSPSLSRISAQTSDFCPHLRPHRRPSKLPGCRPMDVHLVDGTYELFRYHYSPANKDPDRGATRGVVGSCLMLLEQGATHVALGVMNAADVAGFYERLGFTPAAKPDRCDRWFRREVRR